MSRPTSLPSRLPPIFPTSPTFGCALLVALAAATAAEAREDVLLVPDSGNDRIWALSPIDGSVVDSSFIPHDSHLTQPIQAIPSGTGTILITDETQKSVYEYSGGGTYLRTLASAAAHGIVGAFGICVKDGFAYVTSGFSSGAGKIYRIALDGSGSPPSVFCDFSAAGDPRGIVPFGNGFLVGNSTDDDIEFVTSTGAIAPVPFHDSNGVDGINFPQQIQVLDAETVMAAGFSAPWGIFFYDNYGIGAGMYVSPVVYLSPRGCYRLDSGDFLYTGGTRIDRIDDKSASTTNLVNQLGTSFRWISRFTLPGPCPGDVDGSGAVDAADLAALLAAWGGKSASADLDGSGAVDAGDLALLLGAWGPC